MINYSVLLDRLTQDPRYLANVDWGEPRSGHPEGSILAHIRDLERNLASLQGRLSAEECAKLRVLIHTHDTFKPEAKSGVPILHARSHASLAREYLESLGAGSDLQTIAQYHDEPYALWRQHEHKGVVSETRMETLLRVIDDWDLFLAFLIVDGCTEGKSRAPLEWFLNSIEGRVATRFSVEDIL